MRIKTLKLRSLIPSHLRRHLDAAERDHPNADLDIEAVEFTRGTDDTEYLTVRFVYWDRDEDGLPKIATILECGLPPANVMRIFRANGKAEYFDHFLEMDRKHGNHPRLLGSKRVIGGW